MNNTQEHMASQIEEIARLMAAISEKAVSYQQKNQKAGKWAYVADMNRLVENLKEAAGEIG